MKVLKNAQRLHFVKKLRREEVMSKGTAIEQTVLSTTGPRGKRPDCGPHRGMYLTQRATKPASENAHCSRRTTGGDRVATAGVGRVRWREVRGQVFQGTAERTYASPKHLMPNS